MRKRRRGDQRRIRYPHAVVQFVFLLDPAQNRNRVFDRGFGDQHRLKPSGQRSVLFDILPVFIQRRRADAVQVSPRQRRLEQVGGVHRSVRLSRTDKRVHLVDEQQDFAGRVGDLREHGLQPFLELAAILRASNQGAHVQRHQALVPKALRDVARDNPKGQPLDDGRLAYARLANEHRIVLGPAAQHLHRAPDFLLPPDDRIDSSVLRVLRNVARVAFERFIGVFRGCAVRIPSAAQSAYCRCQRLRRNSRFLENSGRAGLFGCERRQYPFHGDKCIFGFLRQRFRPLKHSTGVGRHVDVPLPPGNSRQLVHRTVNLPFCGFRVASGIGNQAVPEAFRLVKNRLKQMFGKQLLMVLSDSYGVRGADDLSGLVRKFFFVHSNFPSKPLRNSAS